MLVNDSVLLAFHHISAVLRLIPTLNFCIQLMYRIGDRVSVLLLRCIGSV